jgi:hypothetical protein
MESFAPTSAGLPQSEADALSARAVCTLSPAASQACWILLVE